MSRRLLLAVCCLVLFEHVAVTNAARRLAQAPPPPMEQDLYRAGCGNFSLREWQAHRPGYHITAPYGWINDPHGMFQLNNRTHLFFQYNPKAVEWGPPFWGHVASDDLVHWTWLPPALLPDTNYDFGGCWSGAATVTTENVPILTYTAASTDIPELGNKFQRQAAAYPADLSDPWLKQWVKPDNNPFLSLLPPGGSMVQWRDPTEGRHGAWLALTNPNNPYRLADGSYAIVIGGQAFCYGNAAMYVAPNMTGPWRYIGNLHNQLAIEPEIDGQCLAGGPAMTRNYTSPAYGGPCDQFGAACRAWEVVDFLELEPGLFAFKWDDQSRYREAFAQEWYQLSNAPFNYRALQPPSNTDPSGLYAVNGRNAATGEALAQINAGLTRLVDSLEAATPEREFGRQYSSYGLATQNQLNRTTYNVLTAYNYVNASDNSAMDVLFQPYLNGRRFYPQIMDYGSIYASMIFRTSDRRQVMFTWAYETAEGCADQCSAQKTALTNTTNFKGVISLPRQLTYDRQTETMRVYPVAETDSLRGNVLYSDTNQTLGNNATVLVNETMVQPNSTARQMEAQLAFSLAPDANSSSGNFKVGARVLTGGNTYVDVFLNGTLDTANATAANNASGDADKARIASLWVWVDRTAAGGFSNTTYMEGGPLPLPVGGNWLAADKKLELSLFIDHSMWEVYALRGLGRVTSRVYPSDDTSAWGVAAFGGVDGGSVLVDGSVWAMENAWLEPNCD